MKQFVGKKCYLCGKKLGNRKPESTTNIEPFLFEDYRIVTVVAPCPFCGKDVPVWDDGLPAEPAPEPTEPVEPTEPTEPAEPVAEAETKPEPEPET